MAKTRQRVEQEQAVALWKRATGLPWPSCWEIHFGIKGLTEFHNRNIWIANNGVKGNQTTICHEFVHVLHPRWQHGPRFDREVQRLLTRARRVLRLDQGIRSPKKCKRKSLATKPNKRKRLAI